EHVQLSPKTALQRRQDDGRATAVHPGHWRWIEHAVATYLDLAERLAGLAGGAPSDGAVLLAPGSEGWGCPWEDPAGTVYEICAWGRRYANGSGSVRELRLPVFDTVAGKDRDAGEVAVAAFVLAKGCPAKRAKWGEPYRMGRPVVPVRRVRVVEVGC